MKKLGPILFFFFISITSSFYQTNFFYNYYNIENLNSQEKDNIFYSEGAFYYSFYKKFVESDSFYSGIKLFFNNDFYEAPISINPHKRFTISFELLSGSIFKLVRYLGFSISEFEFYNLLSIFLNSFTFGSIFLICYLLFKSYFVFLLPMLFILTHSDDGSRLIQSTALRENAGVFFVFLHIYLFNWLLATPTIWSNINKNNPLTGKHWLYILSTFTMLIFWQFTQFVIVIEMIALFILFSAGNIKKEKLVDYFVCILISWLVTTIYLMGNSLVLNSIFFYVTSTFFFFLIVFHYFKLKFTNLKNRFLFSFGILSFAVVLQPLFKILFRQNSDAHVFSYLLSTFSPIKNDFHSQLYRCDLAFNGTSWQQLGEYWQSGFLFFTLATLLVFSYHFFKNISKEPSNETLFKNYLFTLAIGFLVITLIGRRFAILSIPILSTLIPYSYLLLSKKVEAKFKLPHFFQVTTIILALIFYFINFDKIGNNWNRRANKKDQTMSHLVNFINNNLPPKQLIAASMPLSSSIVLQTKSKIFTHPQYEDSNLRERVYNTYKIYGNFSQKEIWDYSLKHKINYIALETSYCRFKSSTGCVMQDLINQGRKKSDPQFCMEDYKDSKYFSEVYSSRRFKMIKVLEKPDS